MEYVPVIHPQAGSIWLFGPSFILDRERVMIGYGQKGLSLLLAFCKIGSEYKHTSICTSVCSIHHHRKVISGSSEIPALQSGNPFEEGAAALFLWTNADHHVADITSGAPDSGSAVQVL